MARFLFCYLVEHPFEADSGSALIFRGAVHPVQVENHVHVVLDGGEVVSALVNREDLTMGADVGVVVEQRLKPSTP